jgi:hypothetical protein
MNAEINIEVSAIMRQRARYTLLSRCEPSGELHQSRQDELARHMIRKGARKDVLEQINDFRLCKVGMQRQRYLQE